KPPAQKKRSRGWGGRFMRYSASEKFEIIELVEQSSLSIRRGASMQINRWREHANKPINAGREHANKPINAQVGIAGSTLSMDGNVDKRCATRRHYILCLEVVRRHRSC